MINSKHDLTKSEYYAVLRQSFKFILDHQLKYPINIHALSESTGARLYTYKSFVDRTGLTLEEITDTISELGFTFYKNSHYNIIYNHTIPSPGGQRWTIMHELIHIHNGDIQKDGSVLPLDHRHTKKERITDMLVRRIMAPMCLLHIYDVTSIDEVMAITGLSYTAAQYALNEHFEKRKKNKYGTIEAELLVMDLIQKDYDPIKKCLLNEPLK